MALSAISKYRTAMRSAIYGTGATRLRHRFNPRLRRAPVSATTIVSMGILDSRPFPWNNSSKLFTRGAGLDSFQNTWKSGKDHQTVLSTMQSEYFNLSHTLINIRKRISKFEICALNSSYYFTKFVTQKDRIMNVENWIRRERSELHFKSGENFVHHFRVKIRFSKCKNAIQSRRLKLQNAILTILLSPVLAKLCNFGKKKETFLFVRHEKLILRKSWNRWIQNKLDKHTYSEFVIHRLNILLCLLNYSNIILVFFFSFSLFQTQK